MEPVCGEIEYVLAFEAEDRSDLFELDTEEGLLTLAPSATATAGVYDDIVLRFYYAEFPN